MVNRTGDKQGWRRAAMAVCVVGVMVFGLGVAAQTEVPTAGAGGASAASASSAAMLPVSPSVSVVESSASSAIVPSGDGEEIMPISKVDQALSLYRSVCLAALTDRMSFADKAMARGLVPLHVAGMAGSAPASDDAGEPLQDLLFTPGMESGMEVAIHLDQRCAVWIRGDSGAQLRKGFQRAIQGMKRRGYPIQWVLDRTVPQKDGPRQLLRAEALLGDPEVRFRFDAALMVGDKRTGIQALTAQLDVVPPELPPSAPDLGSSAPQQIGNGVGGSPDLAASGVVPGTGEGAVAPPASAPVSSPSSP